MFRQNGNAVNIHKLEMEEIKILCKLAEQHKTKFDEFQDKDIFLILGLADSSKNTLIHYLLGREMKTVHDLGKNFVVQKTCDTSLQTDSYPKLHMGMEEIYLCDCPGFYLGDHSFGTVVYRMIALEQALKKAKSIRGIFVAFDADMFSGYGIYPQQFVLMISNLLSYSDALKNSVTCVVTVPQVTDVPLNKIQEIVQVRMQDQIEYFKKYHSDREDVAAWMTLLKEKSIFVDYLDKGDSNVFLYNNIDNSKPIPLSAFHLKTFEPVRMLLDDMPHLVLEKTKVVSNLREEIADTTKLIEDQEVRIQALQRDKFDIERRQIAFELERNYERTALCREIEELASKSTASLDLMQNAISERNQAQKELAEIDKDTLKEYWREDFQEKRTTLGMIGYSEKHFYYSGAPFDDIKVEPKHGKMFNEIIDEKNGKYSATYRSSYGRAGEASVVILMATRNIPSNKHMISVYKNQIETHNANIKKMMSLSGELLNQKNTMESQLVALDSNYNTFVEDEKIKLENIEADIRKIQIEIGVNTDLKLLPAKTRLSEILKDLEQLFKLAPQLEMITTHSDVLQLVSSDYQLANEALKIEIALMNGASDKVRQLSQAEPLPNVQLLINNSVCNAANTPIKTTATTTVNSTANTAASGVDSSENGVQRENSFNSM